MRYAALIRDVRMSLYRSLNMEISVVKPDKGNRDSCVYICKIDMTVCDKA